MMFRLGNKPVTVGVVWSYSQKNIATSRIAHCYYSSVHARHTQRTHVLLLGEGITDGADKSVSIMRYLFRSISVWKMSHARAKATKNNATQLETYTRIYLVEHGIHHGGTYFFLCLCNAICRVKYWLLGYVGVRRMQVISNCNTI